MAIKFSGRFGKRTLGYLFIRPLPISNDDWNQVAVTQMRYEDRGSINDPVGSTEDWGPVSQTPSSS